MQAWQASSGARKRGLGLLIPLGLTGDASPAAQREAQPSAEEALVNSTSSAMIPRETTDMVVKYIFSQAQLVGAPARFCGEMEQVVRNLSADQGVQRSIVEAWEKEKRLKALMDLTASQHRQREGGLLAKETLLLVEDEEGKSDEAWACIDTPTKERPATDDDDDAKDTKPQDMREMMMTMRCGICLGTFQDATIIDCPGSHVFCRQCIVKLPSHNNCWSSIFTWGRSMLLGSSQPSEESHAPRCCPMCRGPFSRWFPVRTMDEIIACLRPMFADEFEHENLGDDEAHAFHTSANGAKGDGPADAMSPMLIGMVTLAVIVALVIIRV